MVWFWLAEKQFPTEHLKTWRPSRYSLEYLAGQWPCLPQYLWLLYNETEMRGTFFKSAFARAGIVRSERFL